MPEAALEKILALALKQEHIIPVSNSGKYYEGIQFVDITDFVREAVRDFGWQNGVLFIGRGISESVVIAQEARQFVEQDIVKMLEAAHYSGRWQDLFPESQAFPVHKELVLGTYQRILHFGVDSPGELPLSFFPSSETSRTFSLNTGANEQLFYEHRKGSTKERTGERVFDITDAFRNVVYACFQTQKGFAYIFVPHTTCALVAETPANMRTIMDKLDLFAPSDADYAHNDLVNRTNIPADETKNGRAHVKAAVLKPWLTVILENGLPALEQDKRVYLLDLDAPRQSRQVRVTACQFQ